MALSARYVARLVASARKQVLKKSTARKFNPGLNQDDNELAEQYVVRESLLAEALDQIRANTDANSNVHCLYYAPRGRGKTMLLARIEVAVRQDSELSASWLVVRLFEENYYEIASAGELWLAVIRQLSMTDIEGELRRSARAAHDDLARRDPGDSFDAAAIAVLGDLLDSLGRRVVLMVENLQELDDELDDAAGWAVRKVLQNEPRLMLMATATSYFSSMQQAKHAFYELFDSREIPALNRRECTVLWNHITGDERSEEQVRPLQILTGGSPRLLNVMAQFGKNLDIAELMEDLTGLIDERTDYFKSQIESLPSKERRVFVALADLWHPSTAAEIAERARQPVPKVSALLNRLEGRGALIVDGSQPRKKKYAIAERLFCIYYKLRSQRNDAAVAEALIDFMIGFYPLKVQAKVREQFCDYPEFERIANERGFGVEGLIDRARRLNSDFADLATLLENARLSGKTDELEALVDSLESISEMEGVRNELDSNRFSATLANLRAAFLLMKGEIEGAQSAYEEVLERFGGVPESGVRDQVAKAMVSLGYTLGQQGDLAGEVAAYEEVIERFGGAPEASVREQVATVVVYRMLVLAALTDWDNALLAVDSLRLKTADSQVLAVAALTESLVQRAVNAESSELPLAISRLCELAVRSADYSGERMQLALGVLALLPAAEALEMLKEFGVEKELAPLLVYCQRESGERVSVAPEMSDVADDVAIRVAELREQLLAPPSELVD